MKKLLKWVVILVAGVMFVQWRASSSNQTVGLWLTEQVATVQELGSQAYVKLQQLTGNKTASTTADATTESVSASATKLTWKHRYTTVYINPKMPSRYKQIWKKAIAAWNKKKIFTFKVVSKRKNAKVYLTYWTSSSSSEAGVTNKSWIVYSRSRGILTKATAKLNLYYMKRYSTARQVNTAEHELGHVMGLSHYNRKRSVMRSVGSYYSIQSIDIKHLKALYKGIK